MLNEIETREKEGRTIPASLVLRVVIKYGIPTTRYIPALALLMESLAMGKRSCCPCVFISSVFLRNWTRKIFCHSQETEYF